MSSESSDPQLPDLRYVRELAKVFKQYALDEIEIETAGSRVLLRRSEPMRGEAPALAPQVVVPAPRAHEPPPPAAEPAPEEPTGDFVTSPFVGTFYRAPRPEAPPFVEVGATVQSGQTLCIVEAMKLFNEIEVEFSCVIEECLVENGQTVEYGANLFRVRRL